MLGNNFLKLNWEEPGTSRAIFLMTRVYYTCNPLQTDSIVARSYRYFIQFKDHKPTVTLPYGNNKLH